MSLSKLSVSFLALAGSALAGNLKPITFHGAKMFTADDEQFFVKGIAYQQDVGAAGSFSGSSNVTYIDPLADVDSCKRDIPNLKDLGTNVIRTYAIDPTADHSECMKLLDEAGIYVISDLSEPSMSINRENPSWNIDLFDRYKKVIDALIKFDNVIAFFAGNEVSNAKNNTAASAFVKAAVRDCKAYIQSQKYRPVGVGYAANDDVEIRAEIAAYFNCGDPAEAIDLWGDNVYSWCGDSDMQKSGYDQQVEFFSNYSVPVIFAEYGCNLPDGAAAREFKETAAIYSDAMTGVLNGAIVYMYFEEENDYGLVKVDGDKVTKLDDYKALKTQVTKATPKGVNKSSYASSLKPAACPALTPNWQANSVLPPTPDSSLCSCMQASRSCVRAKDLDPKSYGKIFSYICANDPTACVGINANATMGVYGAYSMCDDGQKLDYALDTYYTIQGKAASACDFDSQAQIVSVKSDPKCSGPLATASAINKAAAVATTPIRAGGTKPTAAGSFGVHDASIARVFTAGDFAIGAYMVVAALVGATMVAL